MERKEADRIYTINKMGESRGTRGSNHVNHVHPVKKSAQKIPFIPSKLGDGRD
jgi:hypothetical protein